MQERVNTMSTQRHICRFLTPRCGLAYSELPTSDENVNATALELAKELSDTY